VGHDDVQFGKLTLMFPKNTPPPPILRTEDGGSMIYESLLPTYQTARRDISTDGHFPCKQSSFWEHNKHVATFEDSVTADVNDDHFRMRAASGLARNSWTEVSSGSGTLSPAHKPKERKFCDAFQSADVPFNSLPYK